jgi:hypothetical protein
MQFIIAVSAGGLNRVDTRPVDAIVFHHDLLCADDPKSFFRLQM